MSEISKHVILYSNGSVMWLTATVFKSSCFINVKYFPFDLQNCSLLFSSWTYDSKQIDIKRLTEVADTSNYLENNEWKLVQVESSKHMTNYSCCVEA